MKDRMRSGKDRLKEASKKGAGKTSSMVGKAAANTKQGITDSASTVAEIARDGSKKTVEKTVEATRLARSSSRRVSDATGSVASAVLGTSQGVLASHLSTDLNGLLQEVVQGSSTIYDKAMDAVYNATSIGGGNHRLFDGGHTIGGAWEAVRGASENDNIAQEA